MSPIADDYAGAKDGLKLVGVHEFAPKPSVEAFNEGILRGFTRFDEVKLDAAFVRPTVKRVRDKLRSLSTEMPFGYPWTVATSSRNRATHSPLTLDSTSIPGETRLKASITVSTRKR